MTHALILELISRNQWAIAPATVEAMIRIVSEPGTLEDHSLFHGMIDTSEGLGADLSAGPGQEQSSEFNFSSIKGSMGILQINGPIIPRGDMNPVSGPKMATVTGLISDLDALESDPRVDRIAIVCDCPGGSVTGTSELGARIQEMTKPVVTFAAGLCASAMYWVASSGDAIVGDDTSMIGSVGVIAKVPIDSEGKFKTFVSEQSGLKNPDPTTEAGGEAYQKMVNETGKVFVGTVAVNRGVSEDEVLERFGKGSVMISSRAQANGMIDGVMTMREFLSTYSGDLEACSFLKNSKSRKRTRAVAESKVDFSAQSVQSKDEPTAVVNAVKNPKQGEQNMDLEQFLSENAGARAEFNLLIATARTEAIAEHKTEMAAVAKIVAGDKYPSPVKSQASKVLGGEMTKETFDAALAMYEMTVEQTNSQTAVGETKLVGETLPSGGASNELSTDGKIRSQADYEAATKGGQ